MSLSDIPQSIINVNDDEATRYIVTRILQRDGFSVLEAATGEEALLMAKSHPALIILDVNLPDIDGIEVCRRIKANPLTTTIPVLHLSATRVGIADLAYGLDSGADSYLTQPVEPPVLTATVRALLRLSRAEARARSSAQAWEAVFGAIGDGVCLLDEDGRIVRSNQALASLLQKNREEITGRFYEDVMTEAFPGSIFPPEQKIALPQRSVSEIQTKDGRRWLRLTTEPILSESGAPGSTRTVRIVADITDSKEAAQQQRSFLRDILASVTEGSLRLCLNADDLPTPLPATSKPIPLTKRSIRDLRLAVQSSARALNFPEERLQELETAVGEAAMNAVVHAAQGTGLVCSDGKNTVQVWVEDTGAGIAIDRLHRATLERGYTTAGTLGHGFWMILKTCDRLYLLTGASGTTIIMEQDRTPAVPAWLRDAQ